MEFENAIALRRTIERRLDEQFGGDAVQCLHARVHIVLERLLARLLVVAPGDWALTGRLALDLGLYERPRGYATAKIEWPVDRFAELPEALFSAARHDAGDFYEFQLEQCGRGVMGGGAMSSFRAHAFLAEEPFETAPIELRCRYGRLPTEPLRLGDPLAFAGIEPVEVDAVLLEIRVAELVYKYSSSCQSGIDPRHPRDLLDLVSIAERASLDAILLREAIDAVFARKHANPPANLSDPFAAWPQPFRQMAEAAEPPAEIDAVVALIDPILSGEVSEGSWSSAERRWRVPSTNGQPLS